jgi:hypothetical protein
MFPHCRSASTDVSRRGRRPYRGPEDEGAFDLDLVEGGVKPACDLEQGFDGKCAHVTMRKNQHRQRRSHELRDLAVVEPDDRDIAGYAETKLLEPVVATQRHHLPRFWTRSVILLTIPLTGPLLESYDLSLIWFGIVDIKLLEIGLVTPPIGLNVFIINSFVGDSVAVELSHSMR